MATDHDVINRLLALAGMIMEDISPVALIDDKTMIPADRIKATADAGRAIVVLADAASIVLSRSSSD